MKRNKIQDGPKIYRKDIARLCNVTPGVVAYNERLWGIEQFKVVFNCRRIMYLEAQTLEALRRFGVLRN